MTRRRIPAGCLYKRGNRWWWKGKLPGERKTRARPVCLAGEKMAVLDRAVAEQVVRGWWRARGGRTPGVGLDVLVAEFLDHERTRNVPATVTRKTQILGEFVAVTGANIPADITTEACELYLASLTPRGVSVVVLSRAYLSRFCSWLIRARRALTSNPVQWTAVPKQDRTKPPVFMARDEWQAALQVAADNGLWWVWFAAYLGLRRSSLAAMRWRDLTEVGGVWYLDVRNSKGNKHHRLRLPESLVAILPNLGSGELDGVVFDVGTPRMWTLRFAVVKESSPTMNRRGGGIHDLRRAVGAFLAREGVSLLKIAKILGHADVRITAKHYAHLLPEVAAEELERLPPPK